MSQEVQVIQSLDAEGLALNSVSLWNITWHRLLRRKSAIIGMVILGILIVIALTAQWIAPYSPTRSMLDVKDYPARPQKRQSPCIHAFGCPKDQPQHIMGLDGNIRDEFSRILYGARLSLIVGLATVTFAIVIGTVLGALGGYFGGWTDNVIMRSMDVLLAFPSLLLAIAIVTVLGPGLINALLAIGIVSIPAYARGARQCALCARDGICVRNARPGRRHHADSLSAHPSKCLDSSDRARNAGHCDRYPRCRGALLPGAGRAATDPRMGFHAWRRTESGLYRATFSLLAGHRDRADCVIF
jgi:hypothetical protein